MSVKSTPEQEAISISLQRSASAGTAIAAELLAPYNVSYAQWKVLDSIWKNGPQSMKQIAEFADITPSAASRLVDRMVRAGLILRQIDPKDRRGTVVSIDENSEAFDALPSMSSMADEVLLADLSKAEAEHLGRLLRKVQTTARAWLSSRKPGK